MLLAVDPGERRCACILMDRKGAIHIETFVELSEDEDVRHEAISTFLRRCQSLGCVAIIVEAQHINPGRKGEGESAGGYARKMSTMRINAIAATWRSIARSMGLQSPVSPMAVSWRKALRDGGCDVRNSGKSDLVKDSTRDFVQTYFPHIKDQNLIDATAIAIAYRQKYAN